MLVFIFIIVFYFPNSSVDDEGQSIFVPTGTTFVEFKEMIKPHIKSSTTFSLAAIAKRFETPRAGHFRIKPSMGNQQIINTLRSGNTPIQVVFNNQQTVEHLAGRVAEQLEIDSLTLLNEIKSENFSTDVKLSSDELLSLFLPNSYEMYWNISVADFCER
ncbi:MAG: endolytic transglycosylase MltG, partial [Bacteroidota bacterium]|nr:endolytic transglycosylase MltG [Bacteroidota bacterium]